ncbi:hypothetical protein K1T71_007531 [Dendrolimus kikuchii]|uniref:Uncharacterized protein n=1 Tax=Dendrolimus kikuchii TaxID=765133 RepID=A0ACC1CYK0_9NEOP|nr:hypothetical protein K1T71_007531 [Dendrolimus kikuchii]
MFRTPAKTKREEWNEYPTWEDIQTRVVEKAEAGRSGSPLEELLKERREKRRSLGIDRSPSPRPLPKYTTYAERKVRDKELDKEIARRRKEKGLPPLKSISDQPARYGLRLGYLARDRQDPPNKRRCMFLWGPKNTYGDKKEKGAYEVQHNT